MISQPRICCFDIQTGTIAILRQIFEHVFDGTLGKQVRVQPSHGNAFRLVNNGVKPANYHEYDIFIIDLTYSLESPYNSQEHQYKGTKTGNEFFFVAREPVKLFDHGRSIS